MLSDSSASHDWLVDVDFTVSNLEIEFALGVGAYPSFVVHSRAFSPEIR